MRISFISTAMLLFLLFAPANFAADEGDDQQLITISTKDEMSFQDLFELLHRQYGLNFVVSKGVTGTTSVHFKDVTVEELLEEITVNNGLSYSYTKKGNIIRIRPAVPDADPEGDGPANPLLGPQIGSEVFRLVFIDAETAKTLVEPFLTTAGKANGIKEGNLLLVRDTPASIKQVQALIAEIDKEMPQIRISVKIVLINRSDEESQGFDWVTRFRASGAARPITFPFDRRDGGGIFRPENNPFEGEDSGAEFSPGSSFPYATRDDFTFGILSAADFSLLVEFINSETDSEIKSEPEITVIHNGTAEIINGKLIKIPTYSQNLQYGITTVSGYEDVQTGTNLKVTPRVIDEDSVYLEVIPEVSEITGFRGEFNELPDVDTRKADTKVILEDGKTLIIGGLVRSKKMNRETGIPFLKDIPVLGYLFKYTSETIETDDMIIFLTPRIIDREILRKEAEGIVRHEGKWVQRAALDQASRLKTALFHPESRYRMRGLCILAGTEDEEVLDILGAEEVLVRIIEHDENDAIRTAAARILAHRFAETYYGWLEAVALTGPRDFRAGFLVEYALTEPVRHLRDVTLMTAMMINCAAAREALIAGLYSSDTCRILRAAEAFSRFPYSGASEPLTRILDISKNKCIRLYALYALSRCGGPKSAVTIRTVSVAHKGNAMEAFALEALEYIENSGLTASEDESFNESDFQVLLARLRDCERPEIWGSKEFVERMIGVLDLLEERAPRFHDMISAATDRIEEATTWSIDQKGGNVIMAAGSDTAHWPAEATASELMFFAGLLYQKIKMPAAVPEGIEAMRDQFWLAMTMANLAIDPNQRLSEFFETILEAKGIDIPTARGTFPPDSTNTMFIVVRDET